jgi:uncharacterized protein (TIGR00730 family)
VFCGSRAGRDPRFLLAASELGRALADSGRRIVYGGASVGLMGALADAALGAGGEVIGVIPEHLVSLEVAHGSLTEQRVVTDMHVRKATMMALGDAFVALPGGAGTFEEWFEVFTWRMLRLHTKLCAFLDIGGFYAPLAAFLDHVTDEGFIPAEIRAEIEVFADVRALMTRLG